MAQQMKLADFAHKLQHIANVGKSQETIIFIDEWTPFLIFIE